jgi:uncharacterized protein YjeT (DUF2065 family)
MKWVLHFIGILLVALGSIYVLYTEKIKKTFFPVFSNINQKLLSVLPLIVGTLLILSAFHSFNSWFIIVLGLIAIIKGLLLIIIPKSVYDQIVNWYFRKASDMTLRFFGILAIIIGTAIMSWVK